MPSAKSSLLYAGAAGGSSQAQPNDTGFRGICHYCHKPGHCKKKKADRAKAAKNKDKGNKDKGSGTPRKLLMALSASSSHQPVLGPELWLDSGASFHMTPMASLFFDYQEPCESDAVGLGDSSAHDVLGKGTISVQLSSGEIREIYPVSYVLGLTHTLLSIGTAAQVGFDTLFTAQGAFVLDAETGDKVAFGVPVDTLYRLDAHISHSQASSVLELVHSDVCSIMVESLGGKRYVVTFLDDYTRYLIVYLLAHKSEVFSCFSQYKALVENLHGCLVRVLHCDHGREFVSGEFETFCAEAGIQRQYAVPDAHAQNGAAVRVNRTIREAARCMLLHAGMPAAFWGEAVNTAVYV
ncbi:uncharacterized protein LOC112350131 [Selaginella moellendorffii]|uniref:uncharacterized protein LOC112350131 n=1 Tax=Selaginella moellendorffii TaxID=88036 RepID=UPI000D1CDE3C|nr:uncharacterized protein LOC112350131 [Selaginella moellendorffii]|eukprot:XP_024541575.1 uncharacterized protein LOC112350131 [Selaginella moellendorffii]